MIILHLSDIHFGRDNPKCNVRGEFNNKKKILWDLLISIRDNEMKPDHIVVTGDIAWFGKKNDFDEAIEYPMLSRIIETCILTCCCSIEG